MAKTHLRKAEIADTSNRQSSTSTSSRKPVRSLTNLPIEILENVLLQLPIVPPAKLDGTCSAGLLSPAGRSLVQVNSFLREAVIDCINTRILWVHLICHTSRAYPRIEWLFEESELELYSDPFRQALRNPNLPGLHLELGDMRTQGLEERANIIVAFDFRWMAKLMGSLLGATYDVECLNIWQDPLPSQQLDQLIVEQVHSLVPLIERDVRISVIDKHSNQTFYSPHTAESENNNQILTITCAFPRADVLINVLADFDQLGLRAERTLLCMYYYYQRFIIDRPFAPNDFGPAYSTLGMGRFKAWAGVNGALDQNDWETNPDNLERVRRIRTLHYLRFRACIGYLRNVETHGWGFIVSNPLWISLLEKSTGRQMCWQSYQFDETFGLLDYEIAQLHYILSIFYKFRADISKARIEPYLFAYDSALHYGDVSLAFSRAFYAWSCDIKNSIYVDYLTDLCVLMPTSRVQSESEWLMDVMDEEYMFHFGGDPALFRDWEKKGGVILETFLRAIHIAREADVSFDTRRGDELPREYNPQYDRHKQKWFLAVRGLDEMHQWVREFRCQ